MESYVIFTGMEAEKASKPISWRYHSHQILSK